MSPIKHRNEEVREIIPSDYGGVMITDRGKSYDAGEFDAVEQQKRLGHILRNITEVLETKQGRARDSLSPEVFAGKADELNEMLSYHLRDRALLRIGTINGCSMGLANKMTAGGYCAVYPLLSSNRRIILKTAIDPQARAGSAALPVRFG